MKRFLSSLLSIVIVFSSVNIVNAQKDGDIQYTTVQVEFSDNMGTTEDLQVMVIGDNVYANAEELGARLGYQVIVSDTNVVIANTTKSDTVPYGMTVFYYDSTKIRHMLFTKMVDYEAAFESVKNEKGAWIPLEQSLLLLNSSMLMVDNTILIDMPSKNIIDIYVDILKENQKYLFDWQDDIGLSEENEDTMGTASAVVTMFNGLLDLDGDSWVQFVQSFALDSSSYDAKYGEELAVLFCTYSDDELEQEVKEMEKLMSHFNGKGALGKAINAIDKDLDEKIGDLLKTSNELKSKIDTNNNACIVAYNKSYQALKNACDKAEFFSNATELYTKVGKGVSEATSFLDKFYKVAEVVGFTSEFQNQDEFAVSALTKFASDSDSQSAMSKAMKESIADYTTILQTNVVGYSAIRYLEENYDDLIFEATNLVSSLGLPAELMLIGWNVMSDNVPFYKEGLSNADSYMLSMYANIFQGDAFDSYQTLRNSTFDDVNNISPQKLYEVSQYCYAYLKSCYIARNAALGSLKEETKASVPSLIEYQNAINKEIAGYLVQLKNAEVNNESKCYGFLPSDNVEYLKKYDGDKLADIGKVENNNTEDKIIYKEILDKYDTAISENWDGSQLFEAGLNYLCIYYDGDNTKIGYTFIDIDKNGILELLIGEVDTKAGYVGMFFDLYTVINNEVVLVASSAERDRYYLGKDYCILNEGSSSASLSNNSKYLYDGEKGCLIFQESVIYDGDADADNPWFYSSSDMGEGQRVSISEEDALKKRESYVYQAINFTPFSEYHNQRYGEDFGMDIIPNDDRIQNITAEIQNTFPDQFPYIAKLIVSLENGTTIEKVYDESLKNNNGGWYGDVKVGDLTGDGQNEIVVNLSWIGSTFAATDVYVYTIKENALLEILELDSDSIGTLCSQFQSCAGADIVNGNLSISGIINENGAFGNTKLKYFDGNWGESQ